MIWFTSDTHFSSQRALELSKRPFKSIADMNLYMVTEWNKLVSPEDTVFHLGDFGDYFAKNYLKGNICLIKGNYEEEDIKNNRITEDELFNKYGFIEILDSKNLYVSELKQSINLVHKPSGLDKNQFGLFGHLHGRQMCKKYGLDVGVDAHHFRPISIDDVLFYKNAIENFYDEEVFG